MPGFRPAFAKRLDDDEIEVEIRNLGDLVPENAEESPRVVPHEENTVVESPPSTSESESSESEVEQEEEESLPSGNGDAPENEGGEDASEEGIINDGLTEEDYLAGKTDGNEFRY